MGKVSRGYPKQILDRMTKRRFVNTMAGVACSICQEDFNPGERALAINCDHDFHEVCIKKHLENEKTCPICKKEAFKR